ncbi:MAG TPA: 1-acyl-sn-glycerol-3-phosphate acyltransferase [Candidatus Choladousia intestinavium]|uniref:1-acyl-sn-glycerol-3-phosphate acyltransferase n=1 Tax=Candidatus Choladousia intestinavium TaxID=2840727 RepID=A0A9D1AAI3_9FIRM|nr:1-acyl-sn-glycerol-3-phosphate acyltransferase [Candidatus Choladousia intestinavium]
MKRILWMVFMNLWYVPYGLTRLLRCAAHPEQYTEEERFRLLKKIDNRAIKGGRIVIEGDGMEELPKEGGYILYPNHQGMFDVLAILYLMPHAFSVVLKKELQNIPFLKQVFACMGAISLDRSDPREGMKVILQVAEEVKKGRRFLIFAEGTRSRKGNQLLDFKGGSFKSAMKAKCPIVPVALLDSYKAFDTGSVQKQKVQVHFLKPIPYEAYQGMKTTEVAAMVKARIEEKIAQCEGTELRAQR